MSEAEDGRTTAASGLRAPFSRRRLVGAGVAGAGFAGAGLAGAGVAGVLAGPARAQSLATTRAGEADGSQSDPGPDNRALSALNTDSVSPPATDHGSVPQFWSSFSLSHKRVQEGGWARQVNVVDFPISKEIASVNMKLNAGGIRELHWHEANEWSLMLTGKARLTAIDYEGRPYVKDVKAGDLWYFPEGLPHSIQGLGPDGCEFLLVFDEGRFSEEDTTLLTDWLAHTPRAVVAKNFGVHADALKPLDRLPANGRYIFPAPVPPPLRQDASAMTANSPDAARPTSSIAFDFAMTDMPATKQDASGEVRIVDSSNFAISKTMAMAHVRVKPGAMRELHWHTNADEWQYYISGRGRMTVFANKSDARTMDFRAGDVGYIPSTLPHYIENTGDEDLVFLEMFKSAAFSDVSLNQWLAVLPPELVHQHLGLDETLVASFPKRNYAVVPTKA